MHSRFIRKSVVFPSRLSNVRFFVPTLGKNNSHVWEKVFPRWENISLYWEIGISVLERLIAQGKVPPLRIEGFEPMT